MLGPVQVLVIGVDDGGRSDAALSAIGALSGEGPVRCVDLFACAVGPGGELTIEGPDPAATPPSLPLFAEVVDDDALIIVEEGTWHLGEVVPPGSRAVVALLEHRWALGLRDALRSTGATLRYESWLDDDDRAMLEQLLGDEAADTSRADAPIVDFGDLVADIDYPMLVVTAEHDGDRQGCLVGFASQCSIDPPRFMVWISKKNRTAVTAGKAAALGVHFLSITDRELARLFGEETGDETDKFEQCRWHRGPSGVPILDDSARWFVGRVISRADTGDHTAVLLEPVAVHTDAWQGQLDFQRVKDLDPGHEA